MQGAQDAGFRSAWINRTEAVWPADIPDAHVTVTDLTQLADWLEENAA